MAARCRSPRLPALLAVVAAGLAWVPPAAAAGAETPAQEAAAAPAESFVLHAHRFHARQQAAAHLALERSRDVRVRQFAQAMLRDHEAALARLEALPAGQRLRLQARRDLRPEQGIDFGALRGSAFDRRFVQAAGIDAHHQALALFRHAALGGDGGAARFAAETAARIERHLAAAQALDAQFDLQRRNFHGAAQPGAAPVVAQPRELAAIPLTDLDLDFLLRAASYQYAAVAAARLALERSPSPGVRRLAADMLEDHRSTAARLRELAVLNEVALPRDTTNAQGLVLDGLAGLRGADFDRDFLQRAGINEHRELIALLHRQANGRGRDPALAELARELLAREQQHMARAESLLAPGSRR